MASELNMFLKIHFPVLTLEPADQGMRSHVLLVIKASNSSSIVQRQLGSMSVLQTKEGTDDTVGVVVVDKVSLSAGIWKPCFTRMVIG
jgi:hypothetical protein